MYRCDIICWDMAFSPPCPILKISATHFAKGVGVAYMASTQEIKFFCPQIFFFFAEHHLTILLPFLALMLDPTSQSVYYLHRNQKRTLQVSRLRSQMVWNLGIESIVWGDEFHTRSGNWTTLEFNIDASIHITRFGPYKLWEFPGRNNKTGGVGRWVWNTGDSQEKRECWQVWLEPLLPSELL